MNPEITIYGFGYVGKSMVRFLKDHYQLQIYDPTGGDGVIADRSQLKETKYAIICVPTPMLGDGRCDTSMVWDVLYNSKHELYLIKSTVPPGTTKYLAEETGQKIAFSPEYIGEGKYEIPFWKGFPHPTDMKLHDFHIFGGPKEVTREWIRVWQKVAGWVPKYKQTDSTTAELTKYAVNTFLATKKTYCDELYDMAETLDVNYEELRELWLLDGRIGEAMTLIFPDSRGFGGKCLPKDTNALVTLMTLKGYSPDLLKAVLAVNKKVRKEK